MWQNVYWDATLRLPVSFTIKYLNLTSANLTYPVHTGFNLLVNLPANRRLNANVA